MLWHFDTAFTITYTANNCKYKQNNNRELWNGLYVLLQKSLKCLKKILITKEDATIFIELTRTQTQEIVILLLVYLLSYFFVGCVYDFGTIVVEK